MFEDNNFIPQSYYGREADICVGGREYHDVLRFALTLPIGGRDA